MTDMQRALFAETWWRDPEVKDRLATGVIPLPDAPDFCTEQTIRTLYFRYRISVIDAVRSAADVADIP